MKFPRRDLHRSPASAVLLMMQQLLDMVHVDQCRKFTPLLWVSVGTALAGCFASSFAGAPLLILIPAALLALTVGLIWLIWFIAQTCSSTRPRPRGWIAAGVILALAPVVIGFNVPVKVRFVLSAPAFNHLINQAGPPPARLVNQASDDFPGHCPTQVGLYAINDCQTTNGGYLIFDPLGSGLVDNAGFAYLPDGPQIKSGPGLEIQDLVHLQGSWYAFDASW